MLAKCSYPFCFASFRHLGEGRLFRLEADLVSPRPSRPISESWKPSEYFWLCRECSAEMVLVLNLYGEVIVRALPEAARNADPDATFISVNRARGLVLRSVDFRRRRSPERDETVADTHSHDEPALADS